jgi:SSS family solute:Na+ symporter
MKFLDIGIIASYFLIAIGLGFWYKKRASRNLEAYFLGGRRLHWLALAMSGSVSNFDITGTMWIVSILFVLGMKSMWHHWMWGFLMGAFFLAYMGKWVRRSKVLTAAEWMKTRFGEDIAGRFARTAYAIMAILTQASFLGYAFQGIGKFASVYIPLETLGNSTQIPWLQTLLTRYEPQVLAVLIISLTTLYVLLGGLYSVVVTDVFQTIILSLSSLLIAGIAWAKLDATSLSKIPASFTSLRFPWRIDEFFGALVIVWVLKGFLMNAGGPAQMYDFQRFLAAKNERDAAKVGAAWSAFLVVRWAMVMGIVLLALTGTAGVADSERVMPIVLRDFLPIGLRGMVIAGLLAAFMSTFSSTVNSGASFIVRDIWQPLMRHNKTESQAIKFSYLATVVLVLLGIMIGFLGKSIADIWNWMMMALGAGVIVPNVLRWYWWRMNGWGYALGTLGGIVFSLGALIFENLPDYYGFPLIVLASLAMSVLGALATQPVETQVLVSFYRTVRPFGFWKPVQEKAGLSLQDLSKKSESALRAFINILLGMVAITGIYLFPMYLVGHWYAQAAIWLSLGLAAAITLKFTWYTQLPRINSLPDPESEPKDVTTLGRKHP